MRTACLAKKAARAVYIAVTYKVAAQRIIISSVSVLASSRVFSMSSKLANSGPISSLFLGWKTAMGVQNGRSSMNSL